MDSSPALVRFAITRSGFTTSTSWSSWISPAVTGPGPFLCRRSSALSRVCMRSATSFRFNRMSTTSSCTPSMLVYSCSTPSISTSVMALPGMDDSNTRRSALPSVWPKPRSNGSMTTRAWRGATGCTLTTRGFKNSPTDPCIASHLAGLTGRRKYEIGRSIITTVRPPRNDSAGCLKLLRVQLDDEVLVDVGQDLVPRRHGPEHALECLVVHFHPFRQADLLGHGEGVGDAQLLARLLAHGQHVTGAHLVGRYGDDLIIYKNGLVADQLAGFGAGHGESHAVHHVVQAALQQLQQVLTRGAAAARSLFVIVAELALQDAVHAAQLLLLAQLRAVVRQALAALALDAAGGHLELALALQRLGTTLQEQIRAFATSELAGGTGVTRHILLFLALDPALLGGTAAVVRNRRHIRNTGDLQARGVQRPHR